MSRPLLNDPRIAIRKERTMYPTVRAKLTRLNADAFRYLRRTRKYRERCGCKSRRAAAIQDAQMHEWISTSTVVRASCFLNLVRSLPSPSFPLSLSRLLPSPKALFTTSENSLNSRYADCLPPTRYIPRES